MNQDDQPLNPKFLPATGNPQPSDPPRDPLRVPPSLRRFARANAGAVNRVLRPAFKRAW